MQNVSANLVTFTTNKTKFYGAHAGDDSGLGTSQHVVLQRIPNYNNVTLNGNMIANAWNGIQYGLVVFRVKGNWIRVRQYQPEQPGIPAGCSRRWRSGISR